MFSQCTRRSRNTLLLCVAILCVLSYVQIYTGNTPQLSYLMSTGLSRASMHSSETPVVYQLEASRSIVPEHQRSATDRLSGSETKQETVIEHNGFSTSMRQNVPTIATKPHAVSTTTDQNVHATTTTNNQIVTPTKAEERVISTSTLVTGSFTTTQNPHRGTTTKKTTTTQRPTSKKPTPGQKKTTPKPIKPAKHPKPTGLLVNSSACKMSDYDPWDATVADIIRKEKPFGGCRHNYPIKFEQQGTMLTLLVNRTLLKSDCEIECCYRSVMRDKEGKSDDGFKVGKESTCFGGKRSLVVNAEFVRINCSCNKSNETVYEDFRAFIQPKSKNSSTVNTTVVDTENKLSVYMVAIDSVSRLNFKRQMPEIEAELESLGAMSMTGLTKVGRNTLPNMLPFLAAMTIDELKESYKGKPLDGLPLIWKDFSKLGYHTLYTEDESYMSTFNYLQKGFYVTPTDYYMRPLYRAIRESNFIKKGATSCINERPHFNLQIHWLEDLIAQPGPTPHFALIFSNNLSHRGPLSYVNPMQARLKQFLKTYRSSDRFNSSILILFSDHGMRHGSILKTELGGYEARLPFFYILLPPWFATRHPERFANLRDNSHRLTTFFDVHMTLRHLLLDAGATEADLPTLHHRGVSLFEPIPVERSCEDAEIAPHWCVCRARSPLSTNSSVVARAASAVMRHINDVLLRNVQSQCVELTLSRVISAHHTMSEGRKEQDQPKNRAGFEEISVQLVTNPGLAEFEATVRCWRGIPLDEATTKTTNSSEASEKLEEQCRPEHPMSVLYVTRTNLYEGQSDCLKEGFEERIYCYCKDLL